MEFDVIQSNFTAGELSPKLKGRVDLEKYLAGLAVCENMIVRPSGGVSKRGGFHYAASVKDPAKTTTLIAFRYNDLYSYILEFGNNYIRVYFENDQVQSGGSPYEIVTTYLESEVEDIRVTQDATSLYIVHKNHAPAILTRTAHDSWTLSDMPFTFDYAYEDSWSAINTGMPDSFWISICWSPELYLFCAVAVISSEYSIATSIDGLTWNPIASHSGEQWNSVCWSSDLKLFCAVGVDEIMTSPDGVTWTLVTAPGSGQWSSVCYSPDISLFCAVSSDNASGVMTSPDGVTWTLRTAAASKLWISVCWAPSLTLFCAVASSGTVTDVMTSPDGVNWTSRNAALSREWNSVCWSPDLATPLFCAVASGISGVGVMTSPDGVNWTSRVPASADTWRSVCWAKNLTLFIAVAGASATSVMTSPDGVNWTSQGSASIIANWMSVCWSEELRLLVAVSDTTDDRAMVSVDGINWTFLDCHQWQSICWSSELALYVAVSSSGTGNRVATSSDGVNWILRASAADNDWQSVCWCPEISLFIAIADSGSGSRMMISFTGTTWELTSSVVEAVDNEWRSLCWSPTLNLFCAVASSGTGNRVMTSPDGEVWTVQTSAADNDWQSVCWSSSLILFVAVSSSGVGNRVMTSPNGVTWTIRVSAADNDWQSVCWSGSLFVAVAETGGGDRVMTSPDGVVWTIRVSAADYAWKSVCFASDISLFCAVAATANITNVMTSPDGLAWTIRTSGLNSKWEAICWHSTILKFVVVASSGSVRAMYSLDGITWVVSEGGTITRTQYVAPGIDREVTITEYWALYAVCEYQGQFVAIGTHADSAGSDGAHYAWVSSDGVTWVEYEVIINSWRTICFAPELPLVAALSIAGTGDRVIVSEDAISWKSWNFEFSNNEWRSVCWSPKLRKIIAISKTGTNRVAVSLNGKAWVFFAAAAGNDWQSVCWSPERELFVAVASSGVSNRVMTSLDGETWELRTSARDNAWQSVCWSSTLLLFCAVSDTGADRVMTSPDGFLWTPRTAAVNNEWTSVCWSEELGEFIAVASSGIGNRIMVSTDGIAWESNENPVDNDWQSVCWSPGVRKFVAVADTGTNDRIMVSKTTYESWSSFDEYPSLIWFYEQRLFFAATTENMNVIWGSKSGGDIFNMALGRGLDNDALKLEVKAAYNFLWVSAGEEILIGGSNAEFSLSANALNEALTPSNVRPALRTKFGGVTVLPIRIDDSVIFVQQGARKFRRLVAASQVGGYANQYKANDLTILSSHVTESGVAGAVNQTIMDNIIWAFCKNGSLIGLTYEPEHGVFGWHRHVIGGTDVKVKSLAVADVIATGGNQLQDELWAVISHTVDGGTKKYIGYMREGLHDEDTIENSFFVDAGITKTGSGITVIDGLDHLEGESVAVLGDGVEQTSKTVASGEITIDSAVDKAQVGLSFTGVVETLPLEGGNSVGTSQGLIKRISAITLRLYRSLGVDVGDVSGNLDSYVFDSANLFTGDTEPIPFAGAHDRQSRIKISSRHPLPLNLLSIMSQARTK